MTAMNLFQGNLSPSIIEALGWTLVHFLWQGALVALMLWCVLALTARRAAQVRYAAACGALVAMVALAGLTFARLVTQEYHSATVSGVVFTPGVSIHVGADLASTWWAALIYRLDVSMPWLMLAWCAGVLVFSCRLALGMSIVRRLKLQETEAVSERLRQSFDELCSRLQVRRGVSLMHSARVHVPTVIGWLKPVVLLPVTSFTGLTDLQIGALLSHELAHIRRNDYLVSVLQSVVEAVLFYHPAVWWVSKQVRRERECCCDELAVRVCGDRVAYARALSLLEERRGLLPEMVLGANGGLLTMRIKRLLGYEQEIVSASMAWVVVLAVVIAGSGSIIVRFAHAEATTQPSTAKGLGQPITPAAAEVQETLKGVAEKSADISSQLAGVQRDLAQSDRDPRGLSAAERKQLEDARKQLQIDEKKLNSVEFKKQIEEVRRRIDSAEFRKQMQEAVEAAKVNSVELQKQLEVVRKQIEEARKQSSDARALQEQIRSTLNSQEFKQQMERAKAEAARVNTPEFRKQMEQLTKEAQRFDTPEFRKQMEEFRKQAEKFNTPEFREKIRKQVEQAQMSSALAGERMNHMLASNGTPAGAPEPPSNASPSTGPGAQPNPAPIPSGPVRVSSGTMAGQVIHQTPPVYPADAKAAGIQGTVVLKAIIGKDGTVENLTVVSGPKELQKSALEAVSQWQYKPFLLNGQPIEVQTTINVNYTFGASDSGANPGPQSSVTPTEPVSSMPQVIYKVQPEYTEMARQAKVHGVVLLNLVVDKQGHPENVHVVKGLEPSLNQNAIAAVERYRFRPAFENGESVERAVNLEVRYEIF